MNSVCQITSAEAVQGILEVAKAADPVLDVTYGNGAFWVGSSREVVGLDILPERAKDHTADFRNLPFPDGSYPTVVYDPPFHPFVRSHAEARFSGLGRNEKELRVEYERGLRECWRVTSRHLLVKCQGFIHNHAPQWMPLWTIGICGEPFEWLIVWRHGKIVSGRWKSNNSLRRNHADYLLFDKKGNKR
jgi:hypothetical protein